MRIVGGKFKGRPLQSPKGIVTRPTTDRTRESLFNILTHRIDFKNCRTLDLFAGTGALGLEAISRGSEYCLFIEEASAARAAIRENIEALELSGITKIFRCDATRLGKPGNIKPFDLVFADPPYRKGYGEKSARCLFQEGWMNTGGLFILEEATDVYPESLKGYELIDIRKYGETTIGMFCVTTID